MEDVSSAHIWSLSLKEKYTCMKFGDILGRRGSECVHTVTHA